MIKLCNNPTYCDQSTLEKVLEEDMYFKHIIVCHAKFECKYKKDPKKRKKTT